MIKIFYRNQIDSVAWDKFIERSFQRNLYALSWFLDLIPQPWGAVIEFDSDMHYVAALPFQIRSKYGIRFVDQDAAATKELGLFSLTNNVSDELVKALSKEFRYISRYYFNIENTDEYLEGYKFETTYHLDLDKPYSEIAKNYNQNRKRNLKEALSKNQSVVMSDNIELLIDIFKKNVAHKIYGIKEYQYGILRSIYTETKKRNMAFILNVETDEGEVLCSALFIQCFNRLIFFFGASTPRGKEYNSQTLLIDSVINRFSQRSLILDFEGKSVVGVSNFYSSFGANPLKIYELNQKRIPFILKYILMLRGRIIKRFLLIRL